MLGFRYRAVGMSTNSEFWIDEAVVLYYFFPCISRDSMLDPWHRTEGGAQNVDLEAVAKCKPDTPLICNRTV